MDNNLIELIENKNLIVGKIKYIGEFALFERLNLKDALKLSSDELAFATPSMGRGIFKIDKNGQIINIKGVDSHIDNSENAILLSASLLLVFLLISYANFRFSSTVK